MASDIFGSLFLMTLLKWVESIFIVSGTAGFLTVALLIVLSSVFTSAPSTLHNFYSSNSFLLFQVTMYIPIENVNCIFIE